MHDNGDGYTEALRKAWKGDVPESADFVMYWWQKAAELVRDGMAKRFGFNTTNSIHQTFNRRVLEPFPGRDLFPKGPAHETLKKGKDGLPRPTSAKETRTSSAGRFGKASLPEDGRFGKASLPEDGRFGKASLPEDGRFGKASLPEATWASALTRTPQAPAGVAPRSHSNRPLQRP